MGDSENTITLKEIYERLVALETRFDLLDTDNRRMDKKFTVAVWIVVFLEVINIIVHIFVKVGSNL